CRRGDENLLRTGGEMRFGLLPLREQAGRLDNDVHPELAPRELLGIADGEPLELDRTYADGVLACLDRLVERAEGRVVLGQVGKGRRVADVVGRDDLEVPAALQPRSQEVAPDAPEPVDANANVRHACSPVGLRGESSDGSRRRISERALPWRPRGLILAAAGLRPAVGGSRPHLSAKSRAR